MKTITTITTIATKVAIATIIVYITLIMSMALATNITQANCDAQIAVINSTWSNTVDIVINQTNVCNLELDRCRSEDDNCTDDRALYRVELKQCNSDLQEEKSKSDLLEDCQSRETEYVIENKILENNLTVLAKETADSKTSYSTLMRTKTKLEQDSKNLYPRSYILLGIAVGAFGMSEYKKRERTVEDEVSRNFTQRF